MTDTTPEQQALIDQALANQIKNYKDLDKFMKKMGLTMQTSEKEYKKTVDTMKKLQDGIVELQEEYKNAATDAERLSIEKKIIAKNEAKKEEYYAARKESFQKASMASTGAVIKGFVTAFGNATRSALSGGDALSVSAGFMESGIDTANAGIQAGSSVMKDFSHSMVGADGNVTKMGRGVSVVATALGSLSGAISELAKQGIGFMLKETNMVLDGFREMSSVGAIYVGGMQEMISVSQSAGLTMGQFTKAVASNRQAFANAGLSVSEGSKRMAKAIQAGGESARNGMFALGMSMEDQADATAQTMALMAGPTGKLTASNAEVSRQTEEYAKNLKIVSDITGEDAKTKQAEIQKENDNLFMKQKLNSMDEAHRIKFNEMLQNMNSDQRQALAEQMKYGSVISTNLAAAQATSPGIMKANKEFYQAVKDGSESGQKARDIQMSNAAQIKKDAASQTSLSIATGETAEGMSKIIGTYWDTAAQFSEKATKASENAANSAQAHGKAVKASAGGTTAVDLMAANQNFAMGMQQIAVDNLPAFSKALTQTINDIGAAVTKVAGMTISTTTGVMGWLSSHKTTIMNTALVAGGAALTATTIGAGAGALMMETGGIGLMSQMSGGGFADGGISSGPTSGYAQKLHGTEAIVPMKGDKLDTTSKGYAEVTKRMDNQGTDPALIKSSIESTMLLKRLVDLNERILSISEKTLHAVA